MNKYIAIIEGFTGAEYRVINDQADRYLDGEPVNDKDERWIEVGDIHTTLMVEADSKEEAYEYATNEMNDKYYDGDGGPLLNVTKVYKIDEL